MATPKSTTRKTRSTKAAQPEAQETKTEKAKAAEVPTDDKAETVAPNADDSAQAPEAGQQTSVQAPAVASQSGDAKGAAKNSHATGEIPALFVRTKKRVGSRRRVGFRFTREGLGIARSALTDEQLEQLRADPALEVEECTVPAEDGNEAEQ